MRFLLASAVCAMAITAGASSGLAADPVSGYAYDWSGMYVSGSAGYGWSNDDWVYAGGSQPDLSDDDGFAFGGAIGIQKQWESMVLGLEGGVVGNVGGASGSCPNVLFDCVIEDTAAFYVGPKIGVAVDQFMFSIMGGYAGGDIDTRTPNVVTGVSFDRSSEWHDGWFAGAAIDYAMTENVILGVNYKHIDLGETRHNPSPFLASEVRRVDVTADVIAATLTIKFNPF